MSSSSNLSARSTGSGRGAAAAAQPPPEGQGQQGVNSARGNSTSRSAVSTSKNPNSSRRPSKVSSATPRGGNGGGLQQDATFISQLLGAEGSSDEEEGIGDLVISEQQQEQGDSAGLVGGPSTLADCSIFTEARDPTVPGEGEGEGDGEDSNNVLVQPPIEDISSSLNPSLDICDLDGSALLHKGLGSMSRAQTERYFGFSARQKFFGQTNDLNHQRGYSMVPEFKSRSNHKSVMSSSSSIVSIGMGSRQHSGISSASAKVLKKKTKRRKQLPVLARVSFNAETSLCSRVSLYESTMGVIDESMIDDDITIKTTDDFIKQDLVVLDSPRSNYIDSCLGDRVNPRAAHIVRRRLTSSLRLNHHGMGDQMAIHLAKSISDMPFLDSVNISDNALTDTGLKPMLISILNISTLTELNLSQNEIGPESAEAIAAYIGKEGCTLKRLVMQHADVDDFEGERFITALQQNSTLVELDLSNNKLGSAEALNTVMPDITTAPEALADLLALPTCNIETLKLAWNMIRLDSAVTLAKSLETNSRITYLDLSFNSLSSEGGIALANALLHNKTLRHLLIANNNITAVPCFILCVAIRENDVLDDVRIDGNPIGERGAKAMMTLPICFGNNTKISSTGCNMGLKDDLCWFDQSYPCRSYELDLSDPYSRAVAFDVLRIAANHETYVLQNVVYIPPKTKGSKATTEKLDLVQLVAKKSGDMLSQEEQELHERLSIIADASRDVEKAKVLFQQKDILNSGEIDFDDYRELMQQMGVHLTDNELSDSIAQYDVDGSGHIELPELISALKHIHESTVKRMRGISDYISMSVAGSNERYIPPDSGVLKFTMLDGFVKKDLCQILTIHDIRKLASLAKSAGESSTLLQYGLDNSKIGISEALELYNVMLKDIGDKIRILVILLPLIATPEDARILIKRVTENDFIENQRLRQAYGQCIRPTLGVSNGFYSLDLSKPVDRTCLSMLFENSRTTNNKQSRLGLIDGVWIGDTSQHQNGSCFRNEYYNGQPVVLKPEMFAPMPHSGKLFFDYSGGFRPIEPPELITDSRLLKIMQPIINDDTYADVINVISAWGPNSPAVEEANKGIGKNIYEVSKDLGVEIGDHSFNFYKNLGSRCESFAETANRNENAQVPKLGEEMTQIGSGSGAMAVANSARGSTGDKPSLSRVLGLNQQQESGDALNVTPSIPSTARSSARSTYEALAPPLSVPQPPALPEAVDELAENSTLSVLMEEDYTLDQGIGLESLSVTESISSKKTTASLMKFKIMLKASGVASYLKCQRIVEYLEEKLGGYWMRCYHVAMLLTAFELGNVRSNYFGTYRTDIVVFLFPQIVDLHNFEIILRLLDAYEIAILTNRLGRLAIFNPLKPEGAYELNMGTPEDRQVAKIILMLSIVEPGDNILDGKFRWDRESPYVPGWEVTQPWMTEAGLSRKGYFVFEYYSGSGKGLRGCRPEAVWRKALMKLVLCRSSYLTWDSGVSKEELERSENEITEFVRSKKDKFLNYLRYRGPEKEKK